MKKKEKVALMWSGLISVILAVILAGSFLTYSIIGTPSNYQGPSMVFEGVRIDGSVWKSIDDTGFVNLQKNSGDIGFYGHMSPIFLKPDKDVQQLYSVSDKIAKEIKEGTNGVGITIPAGDVAPEHTYILKYHYFNSTQGNKKITKIIALYEYPAEAFVWFYAEANGWGTYNIQHNYDVWIKISLNGMYQNWYWEYNNTPAREVFFGIGEIIPEVETNSIYPSLNVNPQSNQPLMMYLASNGTPVSSSELEKNINLAYQGGQLNPEVFPKEVYIHIELSHFGTHYQGWNFLAWQGDGAVIILKFHIFVIGEWIVQNVMNIQPPKPPQPHGGFEGIPGLGSLFGYFLAFGLGGVVALALIIALIVMFPEILVLGAMFMNSRRGGGMK